jgi:hypothetical protein
MIRKINRINKSLKKHIYEKENRKGNLIMKNQGIISLKFIHSNNQFILELHSMDLKNLEMCSNQEECQNKFSKIVSEFMKQK